VWSVAYSPDGQHIISGSSDKTIRIWDAKTGAAVGQPLEGHMDSVQSIAFSPDGQRIVSRSDDFTNHMWDSFPHASIQLPSSNPMHTALHAYPSPEGWVRDPMGGLLYWVPSDCRMGLHSSAPPQTIPLRSHMRSVSLDFEDFVFGTSWTRTYSA
jgi:WD40 repeat protein